MSTATAIRNPTEDTKKAFDHHLGAFAKGLDELMVDYDESSVLVTLDRTFTGLAEIRSFFEAFIDGADPKFWDSFKIVNSTVTGEVAYLAWEAKPWVSLATDTLVVKADKISVQTFTTFTTQQRSLPSGHEWQPCPPAGLIDKFLGDKHVEKT